MAMGETLLLCQSLGRLGKVSPWSEITFMIEKRGIKNLTTDTNLYSTGPWLTTLLMVRTEPLILLLLALTIEPCLMST